MFVKPEKLQNQSNEEKGKDKERGEGKLGREENKQ